MLQIRTCGYLHKHIAQYLEFQKYQDSACNFSKLICKGHRGKKARHKMWKRWNQSLQQAKSRILRKEKRKTCCTVYAQELPHKLNKRLLFFYSLHICVLPLNMMPHPALSINNPALPMHACQVTSPCVKTIWSAVLFTQQLFSQF